MARLAAVRERGVDVRVEVEPRGIFTTLIPTQVLLRPGPSPGAVPDAAIDVSLPAPATARNATAGPRLPMQRWLFDAKTIFGGNALYQCPRAREEQSGAVAERSRRVGGEYLTAARAADRPPRRAEGCAALDGRVPVA